jgi:6-phosphofructokinase 1
LNAVIRGVVKSAILRHGWRVMGVEDGFDGLIWPGKCRELMLKDVAGILVRGGTILGTTNRGNPFAYKIEEHGQAVVRDYSDRVIENARMMGIEALVVIGGDGTLKIALELFRKGLPMVGVPKTIDNDLSATDQTFGFDTAVETATEAIDKLHTTAESHHRIMILEVMGRDAGWIAFAKWTASRCCRRPRSAASRSAAGLSPAPWPNVWLRLAGAKRGSRCSGISSGAAPLHLSTGCSARVSA